jgi:hypothetical protein
MRDRTLSGAPEEIRTPDPQIRSLVLSHELKPQVVEACFNACAAFSLRNEWKATPNLIARLLDV